MTGSCAREYRVGAFRVIADRAQVFCGSEQVALPPKAVTLLVALIERRGRVISKGELMDLVWPGIFVEEGNVKYQISMIRQKLGHGIIETVGKLGYEFGGVLERTNGSTVRTNLAARPRTLIGRDADIDLVAGLLRTHPLVTIQGTGGVGKTSLAEAVGRNVLSRDGVSVFFLEVATMINSDAIAAGFGALLDVGRGRGINSIAELVEAVADERMLFIIDGCEHVRAAAAGFASAVLGGCRNLMLLATSRTPLGVGGERKLPIDPLAVSGEAATAAEARLIPAVGLLLDRAEAADAKFAVHDLDMPKAIRLCQQLDGLPLALEVVGRQLPVLGFDALGGLLAEYSLHCADPLRNALDVSWSLMSPRGQAALPRLSVFGGSFDLGAATAASAGSLPPGDLLAAISELADHSLIVVERGRAPRYRLLDTTRAYAAARLAPEEGRAVRALAAAHYASKLTAADEDWHTREEAEWRDGLAPDFDSLRGALAWAFSPEGDVVTGFILAGRSARLWYSSMLLGEGRHWLRLAAATAKAHPTDPEVMATVWHGLGIMLLMTDPNGADEAYSTAARHYRAAKDSEGLGIALVGCGLVASLRSDYPRAERTLLRARKLLAGTKKAKSLGSCESSLAMVYSYLDRRDEAYRHLECALEARRRAGDPLEIALSEINLAEYAFLSGDLDAAVARGEAAVERLRKAGAPRFLIWCLTVLAKYLEATADRGAACEVASEALSLVKERDDQVFSNLLEVIGLLKADADPVAAARIVGWTDSRALRRVRSRQASESKTYARLRAKLATALSAVRLKDAMADGAHWTDVQVAEAAAALLAAADRPVASAYPAPRLSTV